MALEEEVVSDKTLDAELDESIRATLKDITARNDAPIDNIDDATIAAFEEVGKAAERARDNTGKFTKNEKVKESATPEKADTQTPAVASASDQAVAAPEAPLVTTKGQPIDINRAPSSLKPQAKVDWANTPLSLREEFHRREANFLNGGKDLKESADFGQTIKQVVEPYRALIQAEGGTIERAVSDTMRTAALFRTGTQQQKLDAIFAIDKQFNGGLNAHFQQAVQAEVARVTGQPVQPAQQPQVFQDSRVDTLLANMQKQDRERAAQDEQVRNTATDKFLSSKDAKGQPLYPFVDNVIEDMSNRVGFLRQANPSLGHDEILKQAYDAAVWANPETRAVLIGQQQAQANQPSEKLQKVEQAKRASAVNVPKRGAIPAKASEVVLKLGSPESDESIRETYRQLTG